MAEKRDLTIGVLAQGGYLKATDLLAQSFIELLRNKMMVQVAGAWVLTGLVGDIAIPRQTGGATAYWVSEGNPPTEADQAVDQVALAPKTVGAFTDISRKLLLQSSIDVEAFVRNDLASVLALAIDLAALHGSGTAPEPKGIVNQTGVTAQFVWESNAGATPVNGYRALVTNQVKSDLTKGTGQNLSAIFFGNWRDLIIGQWGTLDILVDPYTGGTTGTVRVIAFQDVDVAVRHGESFSVVVDADTT
jgi:hypothetical protein